MQQTTRYLVARFTCKWSLSPTIIQQNVWVLDHAGILDNADERKVCMHALESTRLWNDFIGRNIFVSASSSQKVDGPRHSELRELRSHFAINSLVPYIYSRHVTSRHAAARSANKL